MTSLCLEKKKWPKYHTTPIFYLRTSDNRVTTYSPPNMSQLSKSGWANLPRAYGSTSSRSIPQFSEAVGKKVLDKLFSATFVLLYFTKNLAQGPFVVVLLYLLLILPLIV